MRHMNALAITLALAAASLSGMASATCSAAQDTACGGSCPCVLLDGAIVGSAYRAFVEDYAINATASVFTIVGNNTVNVSVALPYGGSILNHVSNGPNDALTLQGNNTLEGGWTITNVTIERDATDTSAASDLLVFTENTGAVVITTATLDCNDEGAWAIDGEVNSTFSFVGSTIRNCLGGIRLSAPTSLAVSAESSIQTTGAAAVAFSEAISMSVQDSTADTATSPAIMLTMSNVTTSMVVSDVDIESDGVEDSLDESVRITCDDDERTYLEGGTFTLGGIVSDTAFDKGIGFSGCSNDFIGNHTLIDSNWFLTNTDSRAELRSLGVENVDTQCVTNLDSDLQCCDLCPVEPETETETETDERTYTTFLVLFIIAAALFLVAGVYAVYLATMASSKVMVGAEIEVEETPMRTRQGFRDMPSPVTDDLYLDDDAVLSQE